MTAGNRHSGENTGGGQGGVPAPTTTADLPGQETPLLLPSLLRLGRLLPAAVQKVDLCELSYCLSLCLSVSLSLSLSFSVCLCIFVPFSVSLCLSFSVSLYFCMPQTC